MCRLTCHSKTILPLRHPFLLFCAILQMTNKYSDVTEHINLRVGGMQTSIFSIFGPHRFKFYMNREKAKECRGATALQRTRLNGFWLTGGGEGTYIGRACLTNNAHPSILAHFLGPISPFKTALAAAWAWGVDRCRYVLPPRLIPLGAGVEREPSCLHLILTPCCCAVLLQRCKKQTSCCHVFLTPLT